MIRGARAIADPVQDEFKTEKASDAYSELTAPLDDESEDVNDMGQAPNRMADSRAISVATIGQFLDAGGDAIIRTGLSPARYFVPRKQPK